ncbi:MAG: electron transfer flavoprotein subunit beta/FixA family protein, partial [Chitinophagales bacterium]
VPCLSEIQDFKIMKILVCISKVPDTTAKISFVENDTKFNEDKVQFIINPYDEWYALVRALEIKETIGGTVTVINVGKADNEQVIRKALALGADEAVRVDADPLDALHVAQNIADYAGKNGFDLIFTGKETIDYNGGVVGGLLAAYLDLPYISFVSKLNVDGNRITAERSIEGVIENVEAVTPCVISAQKGLAEARIPNMRGIVASKTKPLQVINALNTDRNIDYVRFQLPPEKGGCKMISADTPEQLIELLHNEAKVF